MISIKNINLFLFLQLFLPSSAKAQAQAGLSWLYSQLIQPPTHPGNFFSASAN